jgi:TonB-dependent receptor
MEPKRHSTRVILAAGASALALGLGLVGAGSASAQVKAQEAETVSEVVVTSRRAAIESAIERKKNAESLIDSVVADDAGKLPDNSITEVLQRVSGVAIVRFAALNDPDHYSAEGSGIQVRGLSGVASRLNGREIFSANGGRSLSFGDVTPELMAAVDVYKSSTADLIEGGTGGQIDLRTKMPFDYRKPSLAISLDGNYGDLSKKTTGGASVLLTDRWETPIGEIGLLADVAYSKLDTHSDFLRTEPYYKQSIGGKDYFIPRGFNFGDEDFSRERNGYYGALQWRPTGDLTLYQTVFMSKYDTQNYSAGRFYGNNDMVADPASSTFDQDNGLEKSTNLFVRNSQTFLPAPNGNLSSNGNSGAATGKTITRDFTTGFNWTPGERWKLSGALQIVDSSARRDSYDVFSEVQLPNRFEVDLTGDFPVITLPSTTSALVSDLKRYIWGATQDHQERNHGHLYAGNLDVEYAFADETFFKSVKFGARYADRTERDTVGSYNWLALGRGWGADGGQLDFTNARPGDVELQSFDNFFRGEAALPTAFLAPSRAMVERMDRNRDHQLPQAGVVRGNGVATTTGYGNPVGPQAFTPYDASRGQTKSTAIYGMVKFASDSSIVGWPVSGNFGLRMVKFENSSEGFLRQNAGTAQIRGSGNRVSLLVNGTKVEAKNSYTKVLPSFNLQFSPSRDLRLRAAYNITMDSASFTNLRVNGDFGFRTDNTAPTGQLSYFDGFSYNSGNPYLKPQMSNNFDASLEWYPKRGASAHLSVFHKRIENLLLYGTSYRDVPVVFAEAPPGTARTTTTPTVTYPAVPTTNPAGATPVLQSARSNNAFNSETDAKVSGIEIGGQTFFDSLPGPFKGFGVSANYTLLDSESPGDSYMDINGVTKTGLPIQGLSKYNANLTLMYEYKKISARLAYSWRSEYLMSTTANGTSGEYHYKRVPGFAGNCPLPGSANANPNCVFTDISLPIYADDYGSLDAGVTYRLNNRISMSVQGSNLTNEVTRTLMGGYNNEHKYVRSWFVADRRVNASLRLSF